MTVQNVLHNVGKAGDNQELEDSILQEALCRLQGMDLVKRAFLLVV